MGEEGFSSDSSLLYHRGVPSAIVDSQVWELPDQTRTPNHPLKPRHLRLHTLFPEVSTGSTDGGSTGGGGGSTGGGGGACPVEGRRLILGNNDVRIGYVVTGTEPSPLYRNAIGDECVYVESGAGTVETVFGVISYRTGDYVLIPRSTDHRWVPAQDETGPSRLYVIEANSHIAPPKRYLSRFGQLLEHAPYCERDLHGPGETLVVSTGSADDPRDVEVLVKHRAGGQVVGTRLHLRDPPVRRRRLGRLPVPLHVQRRGLHADHRQGPPAAAGPPGVGGPQLRGLQLPAPQGRLPPAVDPGALLPLQRRQRRGHVLRRWRLRGPEGLGHQSRLDLAAPGRLRPRAAAERHRGLARGGLLRRVGRHGRHLRPARARRGRARGRGPGVRLDLGRPRTGSGDDTEATTTATVVRPSTPTPDAHR